MTASFGARIALVAAVCLLTVSPPLAAQDAATDPMPELLAQLGQIEGRIGYLQLRYDEAVGEDRALFADQLSRRWREHHALLGEMVTATEEARAAGTERQDATERIKAALEREFTFLRRHGELVQGRIDELRLALPDAPPEDLFALEIQLTEANIDLDELIAAATQDIERAEVLAVDLGPDVALLDNRLEDRAATIAARIEMTMDRRTALNDRVTKAGADTVAIRAELDALQEKIYGTTTSLRTMVSLMGQRDLNTTNYERLLLEATGDLGPSVLDPEVVGGLVEDRWQQVRDWLRSQSGGLLIKAATIVFVLFLFGFIARLAKRLVSRAVLASKVETSEIFRRLIVGAASKAMWLVAFLMILSVLGVNVGPMLAGLGIAGFVLGFALQDTLSNFAAGLMIMFYQPFDVGDVVGAAGVKGKVESVSLVSTVISTFDNQVLILPNNKVWGDVINNVTAQDTRRVDLIFGIGYEDDAEKAQQIMQEVLGAHPMVLADPEPVVRLHELGDSSVNFVCRPWSRTEDYWDVYWDVTETVKRRFDAEGITIPFPQRDVHLYQHGAGGE
ncbi:MAG: mechanosensitive ion channel [marine benthic group bacterium]|nr:mechanosensitive ion channel [Candidatus Benthicola marisminoris]